MTATSLFLVNFIFLVPVLVTLDRVTPWVFFVWSGFFLAWNHPRGLIQWFRILVWAAIAAFWTWLFHGWNTPGAHPWERAWVLAARTFSLMAITSSYSMSVTAKSLLGAFMQQNWLSPRLAYALFAALNLLPRLRSEQNIIAAVHRTRRRGRRGPFLPRTITLLASAVRMGERAAVALKAKGLEHPVRRTYYRPYPWSFKDTGGLALGLLIMVGSLGVLVELRFIRWGLY